MRSLTPRRRTHLAQIPPLPAGQCMAPEMRPSVLCNPLTVARDARVARRLGHSNGNPLPCLHGRLWQEPLVGPRAPFSPVEFVPPVDELDEQYPIRLTTGRRLDSYNTNVQTGAYASPLRRPETLDLSPEDGQRYKLSEGERVRVTSRRGSVMAPVRFDPGLRPGLAFLTTHFHDQVATNDLTIDASDPKSGTSEFKATAIRIEKTLTNQGD